MSSEFVSSSISKPPSIYVAPSFLQTSAGSTQITLTNSPSSSKVEELLV